MQGEFPSGYDILEAGIREAHWTPDNPAEKIGVGQARIDVLYRVNENFLMIQNGKAMPGTEEERIKDLVLCFEGVLSPIKDGVAWKVVSID